MNAAASLQDVSPGRASNTTAGRHPVNSLDFRTNFEVISLVAPLGLFLGAR